jgi:hypothetical protein
MAKTSPIDLLRPSVPRSMEETALTRLNICNGCDRLHARICGECKCFMPMKVKLAHAECPIGKWGEESI